MGLNNKINIMKKFKFLLLLLSACLLSACTAAEAKKAKNNVSQPTYVVNGKTYSTEHSAQKAHYAKVGKASYYHRKFNGRRTASGEIYYATKFTAAHKTLPMGTYVLVTNLKNKRKVVVRINDRGPFSGARIIDLSRAAAAEIGMISAGVVQVKVEKLHLVRH